MRRQQVIGLGGGALAIFLLGLMTGLAIEGARNASGDLAASSDPIVDAPFDGVMPTPEVPNDWAPAHHVTPDDLGVTVGAIDPPDTVYGDRTITTDGTVVTDTTIYGCLLVVADDVVIRNVVINCGDSYPVKVEGADGTVIESTTIDCLDDPRSRKGIFFEFAEDFTVDRVEIRGCDDQFFVDGGVGDSRIVSSVFHDQIPAEEAHTDGVQIGEFEDTTGRLVIAGNWWEYDREGCCDNAVVFASSHAALQVDVTDNRLDGDFGTHLVRCHGNSTCRVVGNEIAAAPEGLVLEADENTHVAGCNHYPDGSPVDRGLFARTTFIDDC